MARTTRYCAACLTTFFEDPASCTNMTCGGARPSTGWGVLLGPGDLLDRHYLVERVLAVGGAGLTYLAREVDGDGEQVGPQVAIKVLYTARDTGSFLRRLSNEAQILQELSHANIVHCLGFVHRAGQEPYLVTRFEEGGSLQQHLDRVGPLPARVAVAVVRQVLLALDVAHQRAVVHRDLKPDNVLLDRTCTAEEVPHVRVADFGIAKVNGGLTDRLTKLGSFVGTPEYAAPEQFEGLPPTPATDLFAAGGLLWFLLTGTAPVRFSQRHDLGTSYDELLEQIPPSLASAQTRIDDPRELDLLQDVINQLMAKESESRWTVHQVLHRLLPLSDKALERGASTLEFTDGGAPIRHSGPMATLDTTGSLVAPGSDAVFVLEGNTAVPTLGSSTLDGPSLVPELPDANKNERDAPRETSNIAVLDTVPPPPPALPPELPPVRREARPETPARDVAVEAAQVGSTAWVPRGEFGGTGLTPGPSPRALPNPAVARTEPSELPPPPLPLPPLAPRPISQAGEAAAAEGSMAGGAVQAAGCLGLSFVGVAATGGLGTMVTIAGLVMAAWGFGWMSGPVSVEPLVVRAEPPHRWATVPELLGSGHKSVRRRHAVQDALHKRGASIGRRCDTKGRFIAELLYEPDGSIVYALIDDGWLPTPQQTCVEKELAGLNLGVRVQRESRIRVAVSLQD